MKYIVFVIISLAPPSLAYLGNLQKSVSTSVQSTSFLLTKQCNQQLNEFIANLGTEKPSWSQNMLDAYSRLPVRVAPSKLVDLGDFAECVKIKANTHVGNILGKYCLGYIATNNKTFQSQEIISFIAPTSNVWAICVPNGCTTSDINIIGNAILADLYTSEEIRVTFSDFLCQTSEEVTHEFDRAAIAEIIALASLLLTVLSSTCYDIFSTLLNLKPCPCIIRGFSAYSNTKIIFKIEISNRLTCLDGLKFVSTLWIIMFHQYYVVQLGPVANVKYLMKWPQKLSSALIVCGDVSVDTFFTIGGVLLSYNFLKARHKKNSFNLFSYYLHRYIRLTPVLALVVLSALLLKYTGSGPKWPYYVHLFSKNCQQYWWSTVLYVQNFVNPGVMCIESSWYVNVDMQLYLISPVILFGLWKYPKRTLTFLSFCALLSIGSSFYVIWKNNLNAIQFGIYNPNTEDYGIKYYFATYTRATPWIIGVILGYFIYKIPKESFKMSKILVCAMWSLSFLILVGYVLLGHLIFLNQFERRDAISNALFAALGRPLWALAIAWIIWACTFNNGGPINSTLSLRIFQVFNKFTYGLYLTHYDILSAITSASKVPKYFTDSAMVYEFWGTLWLSTMAAILLVYLAEYPFMIIEKTLRKKFVDLFKNDSYSI